MATETLNFDSSLLRVLVVDDDPIQRSLISARLARLNGQTVEAEDGVAAWALLSSQTFDMAIVDLNMPNLDGFELIQGMRDHPRTRHLPIIVVTTLTDRASMEAALQAGASSFMVKPIAWATFEMHIGFLLRLVRAAKDARIVSQSAIATLRAREALLGRMSSAAMATMTWLHGELEQLLQRPITADSAVFLQQRLERMYVECEDLNQQSRRIAGSIVGLAEHIAVSDRKERLDSIASDVATAHADAIRAKSMQLKMTLPPGDTWIACDGDALQYALGALLDNAVRHSSGGACISVSAKVYPDGLLGIEITDKGAGMHPDELARTFAPLQSQLDGHGTGGPIGLGLVMARAIAEAHSGTLEVRSMPGQGTTAMLVLPPDRVTNIVTRQ